jgi:hypothetical protein
MRELFRRIFNIAKSNYQLRHVSPSVRREQLGSHWTDFHGIYIRVFFENMSRKFKVLQPDGQTTDDNTTRRMRFACCITKATDTHSEYVILIALPWAQWLRERASMLHVHVH